MNVGFVAITQPFDTTNPMGEAMMVVAMLFNQLERKNTAAKVQGAMQTLKQQGKLRGRPPFAWKFAGKENDFVPVADQQLVLAKIKRLWADGRSMSKIARALNRAGDYRCLVSNKKHPEKFEGARFYAATIKRILVEHDLRLVEGERRGRRPVEQQIVSHHRATGRLSSDDSDE